MEFTCPKNILLKSIQHVEKGISPKSTLPVLSNLLFEANGDTLKISSTDLDIAMEKKSKVTVVTPGSILIHSKTISSIFNKLPDADVHLKVLENGAIEIQCDQSHFNIHGLPAEEFPKISRIEQGKELFLSKEQLKELIKQTIISVSIDESKHILNGVMIEIQPDSLVGVATDGFRLSKKEYKGNYEVTEKTQLIVPTKALNELFSIISEGESDKVKISYSESNAAFTYEDFYLTTRLIKGQYPDYQQVIPKETKVHITLERAKLMAALERCAIIASMASTSTNIVKVETIDNRLLIKAHTPDVGNASELIEVVQNVTDKVQMALNVRLLLEALKVIPEDKITIEFLDTLKPAILRPAGEKANFFYVVMPIRTGSS
jgi:DNA polymerase-3 subunit beta